jgi:hypothetical protein
LFLVLLVIYIVLGYGILEYWYHLRLWPFRFLLVVLSCGAGFPVAFF